MVELIPYPFGRLVPRMFRELEQRRAIFDLPERRFFLGDTARDLAVRFHGKRAASALGPAAGPQSQLAQNVVLSWLGGSRIVELKTVQILDELKIPRPCIDMHNVGYNVEWSQELKLEQALEEYVKAAMLVHMLVHSGELALAPGFEDVVYDMSVGYDLAGIRSERVQAFVRGMMDASEIVERLRAQIPRELGALRDLDFPTRLADTLTLSTFHGCPPDEIEAIIEYLLDEVGLHCIVKLNPTLLGAHEVHRLLHDVLGYRDLHTPETAFEKDTSWPQAVGFVERLKARADRRGLGFGVKFNNTLIVENHRAFFPTAEQEMYLSGPPLHVLATQLVDRFRRHFGDAIPISFSAGVDRHNFADCVALGLVPVTVCSDLLRPGGYARQHGYFEALLRRMEEVGARNIDELVLAGHGQAATALASMAPGRDDLRRVLAGGGDLRVAAGDDLFGDLLSAVRVQNARAYAERVVRDPRYTAEANAAVPKKIGSHLVLFDCVTCDKCVPVCPNDANFTFVIPPAEIPVVVLSQQDGRWNARQGEPLVLRRKHQIGNFADFCNECGNCDVFCPEDGGPYAIKPRFFGSLASWREFRARDGFFLAGDPQRMTVHGRFEGREFELRVGDGPVHYGGPGFAVHFDPAEPAATMAGEADGDVDLTYFHVMRCLGEALLARDVVNYVNA